MLLRDGSKTDMKSRLLWTGGLLSRLGKKRRWGYVERKDRTYVTPMSGSRSMALLVRDSGRVSDDDFVSRKSTCSLKCLGSIWWKEG